MGLRSALRLVQAAEELRSVPAGVPRAPQIASPWSTGQVTQIVWADIIGDPDRWPLTRAVAIQVPAVARARNLLCGAIARLPLRAVRVDTPVDPQPLWVTRTDGTMSPYHRMLWTIDDCFFGGWSLWACERDSRKQIQRVERVPAELWSFTGDGGVQVDGRDDVDPDTVILIPGPNEGILTAARETILGARRQEVLWQHRVGAPVPVVELHMTEAIELEDDEIDALIDRWVAARLDPDGAVAYTPHNIELKVHGDLQMDLLIEARNAVALDIANHANLPAQLLNASLSTASLTYSTAESALGELSLSAAHWANPIAARLGMDDVVPRGQRMAFDITYLTTVPPGPLGPATED